MSRFVSGGTDEEPTQRDEAWLKAQKELDAAAIAKQEASRAGSGKSLYETLQANKEHGRLTGVRFGRFVAAKQEAFEEATKLTNQFRSLDEDEIEFLDSVQESARAKELAEKKDTKASLAEFRKQQEEAERAAKEQEGVVEPPPASSEWAAGARKRKKGVKDDVFKKIRRNPSSTGDEAIGGVFEDKRHEALPPGKEDQPATKPLVKKQQKHPVPTSTSPPAAAAGLGLGAYSSDSDED